MARAASVEGWTCLVCGDVCQSVSALVVEVGGEAFGVFSDEGWSICPTCEGHYRDGFVAIVGVDKSKGGAFALDGEMLAFGSWRTGSIAWLRAIQFPEVLDYPVPTLPSGKLRPLLFASDRLIHGLERLRRAE